MSVTADSKDVVSFDCSFQIDGVEGEFRYQVEVGQRIVGERLDLKDEVLFELRWGKPEGAKPHSGDRYYWVTSPNLADAPDPSEQSVPMIGCLPALENVVIAHVVLTRGIGCYDFPGDVLKVSPNGNSPKSERLGLDDDGKNHLVVMQELVSNLTDLSVRKRMIAAVQQINPTVATVELDDIRKPTGAIVSHEFGKSGRLSFQLGQESEGFRRFYAQLLALNQLPPKQTIIFEEPEKGIYPAALEVLAGEFIRCAESGRSQILLTTHSPALLDHLPCDSVRVVEIEGGVTKISNLSGEQAEAVREDLLATGELLTVDPARGAIQKNQN